MPMRVSTLRMLALMALVVLVCVAGSTTSSSAAIATLRRREAMDAAAAASAARVAAAREAAAEAADADATDAPPSARYVHPRAHNPLDASSTYIWPMPQSVTSGSTVRAISFPFDIQFPESDDLLDAVSRYDALIFSRAPSSTPTAGGLSTLVITVLNATISPPLQLGVDESYTLSVPSDPATSIMSLTAQNFYGVLRGLETLSQLVQWNATSHSYFIANAPWAIQDAPRFAHRGILLDTSRHFEPIWSIKEFLQSLSYAKLNLFHWHISDHQSFPYHSDDLPLLSQGAYSFTDRYTIEDVADVVEFARLRGIRVMLEFDVPGHASSWCTGYPDVCPSTTCLTPLDPSTENVFNLMTTLFNDFTNSTRGSGVVYDDFFHLGGDEVDTTCWTTTPRIAKWLAAQNYTADQAYMYVVERAQKIIQAQGRDPVNWEEVYNHFGTKLPRSTVIHVWLNKQTLANATANGYRAILSDIDELYFGILDLSWQIMYMNEPLAGITDPAQQALVLGAEACMWGETADTSDMMQTVWPRAAAFAERMWSARDVNDTDAALPRLQWFRCLLNDRGIVAAPTMNLASRSAPLGPGACLSQ